MTATVIEAGCDYITATCSEGKSLQRFVRLADVILLKEQARGNEIKRWASHGYTGYMAGSAQAGRRDDGWIIRLSSSAAYDHWKGVYALSTNVSRFDVQATYRLESNVEQFISEGHRRARARSLRRGGKPEVAIHQSTSQSSTVYICRRVSDTFLRMYNKEGESRDAHYKNCVRFEAEFKNHRAARAAEELDLSAEPLISALGRVSREFTARGCPVPSSRADGNLLGRPRKRSEDDRRLLWLTTSIKGSVETLIRNGRLDDALAALGLSDHVAPIPSIHNGAIPVEGRIH